MPEGAIYVGRPTVWGNPYRVIRYFCGVCWRKLEDLHDEARAAVMRDGA